MKLIFLCLSLALITHGGPLEEFLTSSGDLHGEAGERAARFLIAHMPEQDREQLSAEFLIQNLDLAFQARKTFPWGPKVPEDIFLNDVLPYAVFDESRDPWRKELHEIAKEIVKDASDASDAARSLNQHIFNILNVHYNTGRKRPNQSLLESKSLSMATCTGLSIILVEACRSVGIPARAVGTPLWSNGRGNHTWVEIWDNGWHFTGADEYDAKGLNRGWFVGDAAQARVDSRLHAIYATSWKKEGLSFPLVWARNNDSVAAVNVTSRYAKTESKNAGLVELGVRLWDRKGGNRLKAKVCVLDGVLRQCAMDETKAGTSDLNDMPRFYLQPGTRGRLRFTMKDQIREMAFGPVVDGGLTVDADWSNLTPITPALDALREWLSLPESGRSKDLQPLKTPLSKAEAETAIQWMGEDHMGRLLKERSLEVRNLKFEIGDKSLRWLEKEFGEAPEGGHSLWISMHGGGNTRPSVNDRQWRNQIDLYEPKEGIYLAPRAPTDTWNLWHEGHIDPMFQRLIDNYVIVRGVNPNKVYLMGYSAGGDGVWQLAPRMADRFAAAAMMAGHPNEASLLGLRNLPFGIFMGGDDAAYNRNRVAAERAAGLDQLSNEDPGAYLHLSRIYPGMGHWMEKKDAEALPWMAQFKRVSWPKKVVWQQDDVTHRRFYWLRLPEDSPIPERAKIVGVVDAQTISVVGDLPGGIDLRLSDQLVDLDLEIQVQVNGQVVFNGKVERTAEAIVDSLQERSDIHTAATALFRVP